MLDLFRVEADSQCALLNAGLLEVERNPADPARLEELMRAAHSLKGAARIIGLDVAVRVAHALEDGFVAAQKGALVLQGAQVDALLAGVDLLTKIAQTPEPEIAKWDGPEKPAIDQYIATLAAALAQKTPAPEPAGGPAGQPVCRPADPLPTPPAPAHPSTPAPSAAPPPSFLRVTADHLNCLLGLAGESLVESRQLSPFTESLLRLKRLQAEAARALEGLRESLLNAPASSACEQARTQVTAAQNKIAECRQFLGDRVTELDRFDRRSANLASRLYHEALACRMRPFADGLHGFARMVRDLGRTLGKDVRLEVRGEDTQVDRDILEKLEAPLNHLLRNAVDHGLETPEERKRTGKPVTSILRLEARHSAGRLLITVADDGRGIDLERLRAVIVRKQLTNAETAAKLSEAELLEFLFLPGFTMKENVTEISGRGVGLDVVQNMVRQVRGNLRVVTQSGQGTRFQLHLPLTLSVMRTLLVEIAGEPYALPLAYLHRTLKLDPRAVRTLEGRQHFDCDGRQVGLVTAHQILDRGQPMLNAQTWPVVLLGSPEQSYGIVVDRFLGERELVVQALDPRLGKLANIAAGGLMENGAPVLILDVEDFLRSTEKLLGHGRLHKLEATAAAPKRRRQRVLVVDDSLTVRELERKLLTRHGYEVELAVDGVDGWNVARAGDFQLIISDVDMPRMDGIEFITQVKRDPRLKGIPTMIVSYKDREEDRQRGLQAGADYYLTKGSFHDDRLVEAVRDLIGEAEAC